MTPRPPVRVSAVSVTKTTIHSFIGFFIINYCNKLKKTWLTFTKTTKAVPITATVDTLEDASMATAVDIITAAEVTATTAAPEDVASHDGDALRS